MIEAIIKGITIGLLLSISVGPVMFSVIKQSLNNGHKGGMSFIVGVAVSDILIVLTSNVFTELFSNISEFKEEIGITGSVFLITMGVYFIFFKKVKVNEEGKQTFIKFRKRDYAKIFLSGFFMNILNPAVFLFWLTASTAFVANSINHRIIIFTTCLAIVFASDIVKVFLAGKIRNKLTVHNISIINRVSGLLLIGFGISLITGLLIYADKLN